MSDKTINGHSRSHLEVCPQDSQRPRLGGAAGHFRDENLDLLSRVLDTWFRIPGTNIRFGLDGIVSASSPASGDLLGGPASCIIVLAAYFRGVPLVTVARMVVELAIEVGVGMVPVLGNLFDIGWRANRRNYHLLEQQPAATPRNTGATGSLWACSGSAPDGAGDAALSSADFGSAAALLHGLGMPGSWR